jgi:hypothetical protein
MMKTLRFIQNNYNDFETLDVMGHPKSQEELK